jgi:hypothetical protein
MTVFAHGSAGHPDGGTNAVNEVVGIAEHYAAFVKLCRARIEFLQITNDTVDALCNFPANYTAKLLCGEKTMSVYSLFTMARVLALMPAFQHDADQLAELKSREDWIVMRRKGPRFRRRLDSGGIKFINYLDFYKQIGRKGGIRRSMLLKKRKAQTLKARMARWGNGHRPGAE